MAQSKSTAIQSQIVWQSTLTFDMVRDLSAGDLETLIEELNDAVQATCAPYEVEE